MSYKFLLILFFISFQLSLNAQKFNKTFTLNNIDDPFHINIFVHDTGYTMVGGSRKYSSQELRFNILITHTDLQGNVKWTKEYSDSVWSYKAGYDSFKKVNNGYIFAGGQTIQRDPFMFMTGDTMRFCIIRFDENFDTLWTRHSSIDTCFKSLKSVCKTKDNGFVFAGATSRDDAGNILPSGRGNALLLKTDSLGNKQWSKSIGGNWS